MRSPSLYARLLKHVILALALTAVVAAPALAQAPPQGAPPSPWWLQNAYATEPLPEGLRIHAEGQYGFVRQTGNLKGTQHQGGVKLVLRRGVISSGTGLQFEKQDMEVAGGRGSIQHDALQFNQSLRYDLNRFLGPQVGFIYETDDTRYIESRRALYAGLNVNAFTTPKLQTHLLAAIGTQREEFTVPAPSRDGAHGFLSQEIHWAVHPQIRISESSSVVYNLEDTADHRWDFTLSADLVVTRFLGMSLQHNVHFDNQAFPPTAGKRDGRQSVMIRLSY